MRRAPPVREVEEHAELCLEIPVDLVLRFAVALLYHVCPCNKSMANVMATFYINVQGWAKFSKLPFPGCDNAVGKLRQK